MGCKPKEKQTQEPDIPEQLSHAFDHLPFALKPLNPEPIKPMDGNQKVALTGATPGTLSSWTFQALEPSTLFF
jgi:hypothetical protein